MIHVFVGPTLPRSHPMLSAPGVRPGPPIGHGDLFDPAIGSSDTVLIIDGVYHQAPALRHKEILGAMERGVRVVGAASIGALRAAELSTYGMRGVGSIYAAYASGRITGDDEVAVGQAPDGDWTALTWPLVNLRHMLELAQAAGLFGSERATELFTALGAVYYPQRTTAAVRAVCRRLDAGHFVDWLDEHRAVDPHFGDLKRADALTAIHAVVEGVVPPAPAARRASVWRSPYYRRWSNASVRARIGGVELLTEDRVLYQQIFSPGYRKRWREFLEHRSLHPAGGARGRPLAERVTAATGGVLAAHQVFQPVLDLRDEETTAFLLAGESEPDRAAVARHAAALAAWRCRPGFTVGAVRDDLARRLLLRIWRCPEDRLDEEAAGRGLVNGVRAVEAIKRFVPGLMDSGPTVTEASRGN
ncbi:TfuA-like protein [Streptomyces sp. NPDC056160]|uniref:TfuA-like protein n=1 Tax=Streptomyces sp. NPDC056160 TaxID=3345731 RepID=UPI0035DE0453